MIKYNLKCENNHEFESWFSDSNEFDNLKKKDLLDCIFCPSKKIDKTIMSPMITGTKKGKNDFKEFNKIGDFVVAENGKISESYDEKKLKEYMQWDSIEVEVNLKLGNDAFKCYTCDFTHDYIDINADYRN
jgi:hypothetical protein